MTLSEFLSALKTDNVTATIVDHATSTEIATIKAATFGSLDDSIEARIVQQWTIVNATAVRVSLAAVEVQGTGTGISEP